MGTPFLAKKSDGLDRLEAIRAPVPTLSRGQQLLVVPAVAAAYAKAAQCAEGERERLLTARPITISFIRSHV